MDRKEQLRTVVWGIAAVFVFYTALIAWMRRNELVRQLAYLRQQDRALSEDNKTLEDFSRLIGFDAVKEMEVKQRLNYAKQGETLVVFVSPSPTPEATTSNWWDPLLRWFKK